MPRGRSTETGAITGSISIRFGNGTIAAPGLGGKTTELAVEQSWHAGELVRPDVRSLQV